jgi:hypothetical protein
VSDHDPFFGADDEEEETPIVPPHMEEVSPGLSSFFVDLRDPDGLDKLQEMQQEAFAQAREMLEAAKQEERETLRRARQPGFFAFILDRDGGEMKGQWKGWFLAASALERRVAKMEELMVRRMMDTDVDIEALRSEPEHGG